MAVVICNQVHRKTQMAKPSRAANSVEVCLAVLRKVKVDDDIHGLDVNSSCEEICSDTTASLE